MAPRKSAKKLGFGVSADNETPPTIESDLIAFVRTSGINVGRPSTDVTAALDEWAEFVFGIPNATMQLSGITAFETTFWQLSELLTEDARQVKFWPDTTDEDTFVGASAGITNLQHNGAYDGSVLFTATLQLTGEVTFGDAGAAPLAASGAKAS